VVGVASYVICEYDKVKQEFTEFEKVMVRMKEDLIRKASKDWGI